MRTIRHTTLLGQLQDGKIELTADIFGTTTKYAEIRHLATGKRETVQVTNYAGGRMQTITGTFSRAFNRRGESVEVFIPKK